MSREIRVGRKQALVGLAVVAGVVLLYDSVDLPAGAVIMGPFLLMGVVGLVLSVNIWVTSRQHDGFVPVQATVLESDLRTEAETDQTTTTSVPEIQYEYTVGGETYTSESVYPGSYGGSSDGSDQRSVVESHPEGETTEAYYHPDDPSRSFLVEESATRQAVFGILASLGLVAVGGYGLWLALG